ncbi:MAG: hypothetical protein IPK08_07100 [Bacteroidetes bacterium]|nr:hypothetical protein [Bacteroidota bacterium]
MHWVVSNPVHAAINDSSSGVGVSFSSNSKFLYVSSLRYVYQFDVSAPNIPASQTTVAVWDGFIHLIHLWALILT